jgi:hypothetical protein
VRAGRARIHRRLGILALAAASMTFAAGLAAAPRVYPPGLAIVDPESTAVLIGRRVNAPLVSRPFTGGATSLSGLGRQVARVFERTPALDSLMAISIDEVEFREILWPEFPQSRPATGLTWEDAWRVLSARLLNGNNSALVGNAGRPCEFVRIEVDSVTAYRNFKLHNGVTLVTRNARGELERQGWIRSIAERKGRFKIYSVRD